jgi:ABC-type xylose transport system substrate-binding protein
VENFIFEECFFSDSGKITEIILLQEYKNWKTSQGLPFSEIADPQAIKNYFKSNKNVVRAVVCPNYGTSTVYI